MPTVRRHVVVRGRVQNVWFRDGCRRVALSNEVSGWIRNCDDGTVEAVFEGDGPRVDAMVAWCRVGPPLASVASVIVTVGEPEDLTSFVIL